VLRKPKILIVATFLLCACRLTSTAAPQTIDGYWEGFADHECQVDDSTHG
jgi:hypothetical protein